MKLELVIKIDMGKKKKKKKKTSKKLTIALCQQIVTSMSIL